eukprot:196445-Rhodomonas_salina.5
MAVLMWAYGATPSDATSRSYLGTHGVVLRVSRYKCGGTEPTFARTEPAYARTRREAAEKRELLSNTMLRQREVPAYARARQIPCTDGAYGGPRQARTPCSPSSAAGDSKPFWNETDPVPTLCFEVVCAMASTGRVVSPPRAPPPASSEPPTFPAARNRTIHSTTARTQRPASLSGSIHGSFQCHMLGNPFSMAHGWKDSHCTVVPVSFPPAPFGGRVVFAAHSRAMDDRKLRGIERTRFHRQFALQPNREGMPSLQRARLRHAVGDEKSMECEC